MWICKDQLGRRNLADAQKTAQDRVRKSSFQNGNLKTAQTSELVAKEIFSKIVTSLKNITIKRPPFLKSHDCYIDKFFFSCYNAL